MWVRLSSRLTVGLDRRRRVELVCGRNHRNRRRGSAGLYSRRVWRRFGARYSGVYAARVRRCFAEGRRRHGFSAAVRMGGRTKVRSRLLDLPDGSVVPLLSRTARVSGALGDRFAANRGFWRDAAHRGGQIVFERAMLMRQLGTVVL